MMKDFLKMVIISSRKFSLSMVIGVTTLSLNTNLPTHYTLALRNHENFLYGPKAQ